MQVQSAPAEGALINFVSANGRHRRKTVRVQRVIKRKKKKL